MRAACTSTTHRPDEEVTVTARPRPELTGDYDIDPARSRLRFIARHAMVTEVRGAFRKFEGTWHVDGQDPSRSSGYVRIDAASIDTGSPYRDQYLRGQDFFDIARYPDIVWQSTSVEPVGGDRFTVTDQLTVKGVTRPITLDVEFTGAAIDPFGNTRIGFTASGTLYPTDWGITWNVPLEAGGVLVSDKIDLDVDVSAIKHG
jgi:polyisoprenoid-binding protein YceI